MVNDSATTNLATSTLPASNPISPSAPTRMSTSVSELQDAASNAAATKTLENQPQSGSPNHSEGKSSEELGQSEKIPESGGGDEEGKDLQEEEEEEEEGECGFCLFMKGGGCRDSFIAWEKCIEEAEKNKEDIVEKCFEVTGALKKCMEAHPDYYEPILKAEKMAEEEAIIELEKEIPPNAAQQNTNSVEQKAEKMAEEEAIIELVKEIAPNATQQNTNPEEQKASSGGSSCVDKLGIVEPQRTKPRPM